MGSCTEYRHKQSAPPTLRSPQWAETPNRVRLVPRPPEGRIERRPRVGVRRKGMRLFDGARTAEPLGLSVLTETISPTCVIKLKKYDQKK